MTAKQLALALRLAGLNVVEEPGWKTRGADTWAVGKPEGVIEHHTAAPNPYPIKKLYGIQIKCNMATHPDGTVFMVAYYRCNYSSGPGSKTVLVDNVRKSVPPPANARTRGLVDNWGGNRHFWNFENSHLGQGQPLPRVQFDAIVESTRVVIDYWGLNANQVIGHSEWSRRKTDPYWDSDRRAIEDIRAALYGDNPGNGEGTVLLPMELEAWVTNLSDDNLDDMKAAGLYTGDSQYWKDLRDNDPGNEVWERFYTDVDVNAKIGSVS